ncbi:MAG: pyridoxal kinase PdxY [Rhodospirillaceae bacterium]|nr:pyridoxal kinase PdxY [Rhodospirillaceae bacterium]
MSILSIQSHVAFGHVGNDAAVFPLQLMGHEVWPIHTVQFSNHTGYGAWTGQVFDAAIVGELLEGIAARGAIPACRAVLSGYMGSAAIVDEVTNAVAKVRAANPDAIYCCDPVMGDVGRGIFVQPGIPEILIDTAIPLADIVTPNQFELELISGHSIASTADAVAAAKSLLARGPKVVVVTSLTTAEANPADIRVLAVTADGAWTVTTPLLDFPIPLNGAGDTLSALFLGHTLNGRSVPDALSATVSGLFQVFTDTQSAGTRELQLVTTGAKMLAPDLTFTATPL